jgi:FkbM family methyltransferase
MNQVFDPKKPFSIYGFGNWGRQLRKNLESKGHKAEFFLDKRATPGQIVDGTKCLNLYELKQEKVTQVVIGVYNREVSPRSIEKLLTDGGVSVIITFQELLHYVNDVLKASFWFDPKINLDKFQTELNSFKSILADDESIETLEKLVIFRKTGKISDHLEGIGLEKQYFNVNIPRWLNKKSIIMLDCGAFDGDTILSAIENKTSLSKAYCFEPDAKNFNLLHAKTKTLKGTEYILVPCATWSETKIISFQDSEGESSRVSESSGSSVKAVSIDDFMANSPYDFLKIDVEGADLDTLRGAINSINTQRPYIAVGIYHRPSDLWEIPLFLNKNLKKYKYYLRQHGHNGIDTVLYALPT